MDDDTGGFIVGLVIAFIATMVTSACFNTNVYPTVINQANQLCVNYNGLDYFEVDNTRELTVHCNNGQSFTTHQVGKE